MRRRSYRKLFGFAARTASDHPWSHLPLPPAHDAQKLVGEIPSSWLRAEAQYGRDVLRPTHGDQVRLYEQMTGRLPAELVTPAEKLDEFEYYTRTPPRRDLPLYCRRPTQGGDEHVLLDLGALADRHGYAALGAFTLSHDHSLLAYTVDLSGSEEWELRVVEASSGRSVSRRKGVLSVEWACREELVYTRLDGRGRPCAALVHTAGTALGADISVLEEPDDAAVVDVAITKSRRWLTLNSNTHTASEVHLLAADAPRAAGAPLLVAPREVGVSYFVEELPNRWLLLIANSAPPGRALGLSALHESCLPSARPQWTSLYPPQEDVPIEDVDVFADWLVLYERAAGIPRARVLRINGGDTADSSADSSSADSSSAGSSRQASIRDDGRQPAVPTLIEDGLIPLPTAGAPCALSPAPNRAFTSSDVNLQISSPTAPPTPYTYDMRTRVLRLRGPPSEPPPSAELICERSHATARDGARVPLTIVRRADLEPCANTPLHLIVYGAYGASLAAEWRAEHLPLLESGWLIALAHVRGGGELGPAWHRAGAGVHKQTSAKDLLDVLQSFHANGVSCPARSTASADSAGGLALGGLMNLAPRSLAAGVLRGPFLDPLGAMLDPSLPLAVEERDEWGDPAACDLTRAAMERYSPYEALRVGERYPALLLVAAELDTRVPLSHSLTYASRLRQRSKGVGGEGGHDDEESEPAAPVVLHVRECGGHQGEGGRYRRFEQASLELAFLMHSVGEGERQ